VSILVENLSKQYGQQMALDGISFSVGKGEILGLLGPNGAGKSTTMKILTCYLVASSGRAEVCGQDVTKHPLEVKSRIGYLPEHNPLYPDMYIREFLDFTGGLYKIPSAKRKNRIEELIELTGLTAERKKKIGQLDPEVLILDEPTTGLDPNQIIEIRNLIAETGKSKTVILSTHIMQEVSAICQRAVIIHRGSIVADKPVTELGSSLQGNPVLRIRFMQRYNLGWMKNQPGVLSVKQEEENLVLVEFREEDSDQTRAAIFTEAASRQQIITEMEKTEASLEQVFQQLTK